MNKIIKNKRYDTETATVICTKKCMSVSYGSDRCGSAKLLPELFRRPAKRYVSAVDYIYRKQNGEYFLYHMPTGANELDSEEYITPLSDEQALDYCQKWMTGDEYEKIFGKVEE